MRLKFIILAILVALISQMAAAQDPEAVLSELSPEARDWVNRSCSRSLGPSLWNSCILREAPAASRGKPDLAGLTPELRTWVINSCSDSLGPSLAISCLDREKAALTGGLPDTSSLTEDQKEWLSSSCSRSLGPSLWVSCTQRESAALLGTKSAPQQPHTTAAPVQSSSPSTVSYTQQSSVSDAVGSEALILLAILLAAYLFPWIVAKFRGHRSSLAIFWMVILLGWTGFGWVFAFIWACTSNTEKNQQAKVAVLATSSRRVAGVLVIVAAIIGGGVYYKDDVLDIIHRDEIAELTRKLEAAKGPRRDKDVEWFISYETDPAGQKEYARQAWTYSLDGLCSLSVESRLDGSKLTGLECPGYKVSVAGFSSYINVKFDNLPESSSMEIQKYSDAGFGRVDSFYFDNYGNNRDSGTLGYDEFIRQLGNSNTVAFEIPWKEPFWVAFDLKGSALAISMLGHEK